MTDFFGFIGKESLDITQDLMNELNNSHKSGSFQCYYRVGFDLSVYENDSLFVVSLGYISSIRSESLDAEHATSSSCAINLANLYSSCKRKFYDVIDGNFSFCLFDKRQKKTILARDKMGSRPLFICFQEDYFLFSSHQKFFLNNPSFKLSLDDETMANYLALQIQKDDKTFFNEIKRVTPFSVLLFDNDLRKLEYRKYSFDNKGTAVFNPLQDFEIKFVRAIRRCWKDAARIGLMFSGGLDSSAIAAGLKVCGYRDIESFSCNYSHLSEEVIDFSDEREFQIDVINKLNFSHTKIELKDVSPIESLVNQFTYFAEPTHFPNLYMFEKVASEAQSKMIDIIFDGQDGDNVISHGTERFRELAQVGNIFVLFYELICYSKYNGIRFRLVLKSILRAILIKWRVLKPASKNLTLLKQQAFEKYTVGEKYTITSVDSHFKKLSNPLHAISLETKYLIFKNYDIHVRSPFYDKDLIEFCLNVPSKWKLRHGQTRFILRKYLFGMGLEKVGYRRNKANLGYGLVENIRRLDLEKIHYELDDIHPYLQKFVNKQRLFRFFRDFKSGDGWKDRELMGVLAVFTANYWLKYKLNFESINNDWG